MKINTKKVVENNSKSSKVILRRSSSRILVKKAEKTTDASTSKKKNTVDTKPVTIKNSVGKHGAKGRKTTDVSSSEKKKIVDKDGTKPDSVMFKKSNGRPSAKKTKTTYFSTGKKKHSVDKNVTKRDGIMITNSIGRPPAKRMKTTDLSTPKKKNSVDKNVTKRDGVMITNSIGRPPAKRMKTTDLSTRKKKNSVDKNVKKLDGIIRRHKNGRFKAKRRKTPVASTTFDKKDTKHVIQQRRKDNTSTSVKIKQPATSLKKSSTVSTILGNVSSQKMIGDCWMVASKETQNSDLKLCLQKKGSNGKLTPHPPSVKSRKRHNSEEGSNQSIDSQQVSEVRCHQPLESQQVSEIGCNQPLEFQQISGGGSDHQPFESRVTEDCNMQNPVNLVNVTRKKVSKRRKLRLAYKSRQSHANNVADQHISQDQLTTEEKSKLPKKRKISQRKRNVKTANVKTEDESAVENLMLDMYVKTDDISNCSVRISDFMVQNKQEYLSRDDSSDNVVIETNSSCGDVEMLLPECITYLQNQEPPNSIMESGEPSQNEEILEDSTFDIGSLNNDDFNSLLNTETFKECVETGFCDREYSCQIYPEEGEVDKLEHLNETTEDCNNIHERDSTLVRDQQMYDGLENVLVTNIIICPSDMYILDDVDGKTEPHSEEVQFLTLDNEETCGTVENIDSRRNGKNIDCEIDETKKQNFYQDALFEHTTNNSIKKNDVPKNTDCQKLDLEECSFDETTIALDENQVNQDGYVYSEINQDIMKDQDSVCMNVNIESCDLENNVHENYTRKKVIDNSIYEEAREDKTVLEEIGPRDCNPVDNLCTLEDSGDIQKYVKTDETSQTVDKNNDNESDSVTVNEDSFTSKFLTSPCKLYSLFLLQDYSSEESDNEPTEETVILNEDDENDNDGSASSDSDGTENGKDTDKTESVGESVCQSPACKKQNDRDSEDCDRLSLYCDSSDFFSSDNDEKSAQRENIAKKKSSLDTNSDRNVKNLNEPTQKQTSHTDSASAAASSLTRQESAQTKQAVTLQNQTSRARRVIDIQAKHLGSQPVKTVGYALSSNDVKYPLLNYTPRHAFPDYYSYTYPGKYMLEKCCKASELCVQLRNPKLPLSYPQRECMRNVVSPREEYIKHVLYSNRRVIVGARRLILNLVNKGMLVEAWREIVRHGLYQEINIKCLEDMAKNGCLMKSDDAWQMVTEILSKLRFIITYDLQALCLQLIKLLCDINDTKRAMIIFDQMQFQLNGFVSMDILDQLLSGLLATSQWETAKRVVCRLLQNRLRPKEYVVGQILHKLYYDFDSQSIFELLKQLEKFGMKRKHLVFQDALHLLRKLVLDKNYSHRSTSLKRNPEMMKLVEPQTLKELVDAIWDCPNGTHVGRMCAEFFVAWSPEGCYSPVLHQEICGYVTKNSDFQIKVFADFISEFDKASKVSTVVRKASIELLNGLLLEALALGNKDLAIQIIFPSMESRCILIHDRGLSCLIDVLWNAGTRKWPVARRLFDSRSGLYFSKHKVRPFEVLIHETSTSAEIYFTIEKLLFSHERLFHKRTCFYNVRVIIRRATQPKGLNKFKFKYDCINRVTNIIENRFQPPLKINRIYPSTDTSSQDVIIVSYNSIHTWLVSKGFKINRSYTDRHS